MQRFRISVIERYSQHFIMKKLSITGLVSILIFALSGCQPTEECGTWTFSGTPGDHSFSVVSAFTFDPSKCGKNCTCDTDCIIQMVRIYNKDDGSFMYAGDQPGAPIRATPNGWTIDQLGGWAYGYYGLNNDGVSFDNYYNPPGKNGVATTLRDVPGGWPNNIIFSALDVAVCFKSKTCPNEILGYYYWSWTIDNNGTSAQFIAAPAWQDLNVEFQTAATGWNTWAPTSGSQDEGVSGQPVLPNAVPLPVMSDL
jgi:hypothetical protein